MVIVEFGQSFIHFNFVLLLIVPKPISVTLTGISIYNTFVQDSNEVLFIEVTPVKCTKSRKEVIFVLDLNTVPMGLIPSK